MGSNDDQRHTSFFNQKLDSLAELIQNDLDEIKMALKTCQPRKKPTREYLERIAADLGLQCFVDTIIKDNGYLNTLMISGSIVVIDVEMNESDDNHCQRVSVSFAIETDKDSRIDKVLLSNLQENRLYLFQQNLETLARLDRQTSGLFDAFHCLRIICNDLDAIHQMEKRHSGKVHDLLTVGHGIILTHQSYLWSQIYFWLPAVEMLRLDQFDNDPSLLVSNARDGARMAKIQLEQSASPSAFLPSGYSSYFANDGQTVRLSPLLAGERLAMLFPTLSESYAATGNYRYTFYLEQPIYASPWTIDQLEKASGFAIRSCRDLVDDTTTFNNKTSKFLTLEECLLSGSAVGIPFDDCRRTLEECWFRDPEYGSLTIAVVSSIAQPCTQIKCIPFNHPSQILRIIQLLRLQLTFNELLSSCFSGHTVRNNYAASQTPAVEVSVDEAPLSMSIRFRDNDLRLKVHLSAEDPNNPGLSTAEAGGDSIATDADLERIRRAICTCKSIPLVTQWWFAKIY